MTVQAFTFNDFQENTYVLYDESLSCIIIDPGCNNEQEETMLSSFISEHKLTPVGLLNTHCHIDHILGNKYITEKYSLELIAHEGEIPVLQSGIMVSQMYGIPYNQSPEISSYLKGGDVYTFGNTNLQVLYTPGHSPASISFYNAVDKILIAGDVLFQNSIGRTDLPGGNFDTLIHSIKSKFWELPDETIVYSGHGPATTIGNEKTHNPFLQA
jgi:glyoxylase-like metal-dependent hydrolase (beta-lactamase superfamily II)